MTIQQARSYGKDLGGPFYSRIVSNVEEIGDHVLFCPGAINYFGDVVGRVVEIDRSNGNVVLQASVRAPRPFANIVFHNAKRLEIYSN